MINVKIGKFGAECRLKPTRQDLNFYAHELREFALMEKHGMNYVQAHAQALKEYNIPHVRGYESNLYTKEAEVLGDQWYRNLNK